MVRPATRNMQLASLRVQQQLWENYFLTKFVRSKLWKSLCMWHTRTQIPWHMRTRIHLHIRTCTHINTHTPRHTHKHARMHTHTRWHTHTYTHTQTHTHIHKHNTTRIGVSASGTPSKLDWMTWPFCRSINCCVSLAKELYKNNELIVCRYVLCQCHSVFCVETQKERFMLFNIDLPAAPWCTLTCPTSLHTLAFPARSCMAYLYAGICVCCFACIACRVGVSTSSIMHLTWLNDFESLTRLYFPLIFVQCVCVCGNFVIICV